MGGKVETVSDFICFGSKSTAHGDCSHEIKRYLLLESCDKPKPRQSIKKQRHNLPTKFCIFKANFSSCHVWMWELDHKGGECRRIGAFERGAGEDSWESLGLQGDPTSQS